MRTKFHVAIALACACSAAAYAANPFGQFKGRMKEGQYEIRIESEMPGMPANMGKQAFSTKHCVSQKDIDEGQLGKGRDGKAQERCEVKDFKMSGNTATYTTVCKGEPATTVDSQITFSDAGYKMVMKMAMNQGGHMMNMTQHVDGRYLGACPK